jgi:hypothetical protein
MVFDFFSNTQLRFKYQVKFLNIWNGVHETNVQYACFMNSGVSKKKWIVWIVVGELV